MNVMDTLTVDDLESIDGIIHFHNIGMGLRILNTQSIHCTDCYLGEIYYELLNLETANHWSKLTEVMYNTFIDVDMDFFNWDLVRAAMRCAGGHNNKHVLNRMVMLIRERLIRRSNEYETDRVLQRLRYIYNCSYEGAIGYNSPDIFIEYSLHGTVYDIDNPFYYGILVNNLSKFIGGLVNLNAIDSLKKILSNSSFTTMRNKDLLLVMSHSSYSYEEPERDIWSGLLIEHFIDRCIRYNKISMMKEVFKMYHRTNLIFTFAMACNANRWYYMPSLYSMIDAYCDYIDMDEMANMAIENTWVHALEIAIKYGACIDNIHAQIHSHFEGDYIRECIFNAFYN